MRPDLEFEGDDGVPSPLFERMSKITMRERRLRATRASEIEAAGLRVVIDTVGERASRLRGRLHSLVQAQHALNQVIEEAMDDLEALLAHAEQEARTLRARPPIPRPAKLPFISLVPAAGQSERVRITAREGLRRR